MFNERQHPPFGGVRLFDPDVKGNSKVVNLPNQWIANELKLARHHYLDRNKPETIWWLFVVQNRQLSEILAWLEGNCHGLFDDYCYDIYFDHIRVFIKESSVAMRFKTAYV
jgi:hypothetical protein